MLWESFFNSLELHSEEEDIGFLFRSAFGMALDDLTLNKAQSERLITNSKGEKISEKSIFDYLFANYRLGLFIPNKLDGGVLSKYKWNDETRTFEVIQRKNI